MKIKNILFIGFALYVLFRFDFLPGLFILIVAAGIVYAPPRSQKQLELEYDYIYCPSFEDLYCNVWHTSRDEE